MLNRLAAVCAALILAAAAFSAPAQAQRHGGGGHFGGGGGHFSGGHVGGAYVGGARVGGYSGVRVGGAGLTTRATHVLVLALLACATVRTGLVTDRVPTTVRGIVTATVVIGTAIVTRIIVTGTGIMAAIGPIGSTRSL